MKFLRKVEKSLKVKVITGIVFVDMITKIVARMLLPEGSLDGGSALPVLSFGYYINRDTSRIALIENPGASLVLFCTMLLLLTVTIIMLKRRGVRNCLIVLANFAICSLFVCFYPTLKKTIPLIRFSDKLYGFLPLVAIAAFLSTVLFYAKERYSLLMLGFFVSAAIGNALSYLYYPFAPVDFVVVSVRQVGIMKVMNIADIGSYLGCVCLIFYFPYLGFKKLGKAHSA